MRSLAVASGARSGPLVKYMAKGGWGLGVIISDIEESQSFNNFEELTSKRANRASYQHAPGAP